MKRQLNYPQRPYLQPSLAIQTSTPKHTPVTLQPSLVFCPVPTSLAKLASSWDITGYFKHHSYYLPRYLLSLSLPNPVSTYSLLRYGVGTLPPYSALTNSPSPTPIPTHYYYYFHHHPARPTASSQPASTTTLPYTPTRFATRINILLPPSTSHLFLFSLFSLKIPTLFVQTRAIQLIIQQLPLNNSTTILRSIAGIEIRTVYARPATSIVAILFEQVGFPKSPASSSIFHNKPRSSPPSPLICSKSESSLPRSLSPTRYHGDGLVITLWNTFPLDRRASLFSWEWHFLFLLFRLWRVSFGHRKSWR